MFRKRLIKERQSIQKRNNLSEFILVDNSDSMYKLTAYIFGPQNSPFEDGIFELQIQIGEEYPIKPPKLVFKTKVFHPNIHFKTGEVCLDILKENWSPAWTLETICRAIISLLQEPNAESPLNCDAGNMIRNGDNLAYEQLASLYVEELAINKKDFLKEIKKQGIILQYQKQKQKQIKKGNKLKTKKRQ